MRIEGAPGPIEVASGIVGFQARETAAEDVAVKECCEEDEAASERGELVAVAAAQAFEQALADEAAEVVGHLARGVWASQVLLDQWSQVPGVEPPNTERN